MFSHMVLGSDDIERSRGFYDAVFAALGGKPGVTDAKGRLVYAHGGARLLITRPINGEEASAGNGVTVGFHMASPEEAKAWHQAGVDNGGRSVENPPGVRETPFGDIFLAYLRDPDGNKLCGLHRMGEG